MMSSSIIFKSFCSYVYGLCDCNPGQNPSSGGCPLNWWL